jgi:DNA-directed RNA polymerase specialized sigma24 family protein
VAAAKQKLDEAKVMAGVLALLVAEREDRLNAGSEKYKPAKTEVVLAGAGLTAPEVAQLVGKNLDGVKKTIQRGRK